MKLAREGYPFAAAGLLLAGAAGVGAMMRPDSVVLLGVAVLLAGLAIFVVWFFRDPTRPLPTDSDLVVAPGEGRVIGIEEVEEPAFLRGAAHKISIFLSVFDVHVQRAPVSGTVEHKTYRPGKYAVAWLDKASEENEQASLGIATPNGRVLVNQIAGLVETSADEVRTGVRRVRDRLSEISDRDATNLRESADALLPGLAGAADLEPARAYRREVAGLSSSYDAPTEAQRLDLGRLAELVDALESEMNIFLVGVVARFRDEVLAANLEVFPSPRLVGN